MPGTIPQYYTQRVIRLPNSLCWRLAVSLIVIASGGCSPESKVQTYPTVVQVAYKNGKPVNGAVVTFRSVADPSISAKGHADLDGTCNLTTYAPKDGAILGEHEAIVVGGVGGANVDLDGTQLPTISPAYSSYSTANLRFTVTENEEDNHFKIIVTP